MKRATKAARKATSAKAKKEYAEMFALIKKGFKQLSPEDRFEVWKEDFQELLSQAALEYPVPTVGALIGLFAGCWVDKQKGRRER